MNTYDWLSVHFPDLTDIEPLAEGGQKIVLTARHSEHNQVVLKIIRPPVDQEEFDREILAVQQVESPRVPRILSHGNFSSQLGLCFWILEERIPGQTVRQLLQYGPLEPEEVTLLALHMLEPLSKAETVNIVHRDVKPENIIRGENGDFWLLDFGIARHLKLTSLTDTAQLFGKITPGYAPPEQCLNLKPNIDSRADLFALGVTLYECATGSNPFHDEAANPIEVITRIQTTALPALNLNFPASEEFRDLIQAMTQRRRNHRLETVSEALEWIQEIRQNVAEDT